MAQAVRYINRGLATIALDTLTDWDVAPNHALIGEPMPADNTDYVCLYTALVTSRNARSDGLQKPGLLIYTLPQTATYSPDSQQWNILPLTRPDRLRAVVAQNMDTAFARYRYNSPLEPDNEFEIPLRLQPTETYGPQRLAIQQDALAQGGERQTQDFLRIAHPMMLATIRLIAHQQ